MEVSLYYFFPRLFLTFLKTGTMVTGILYYLLYQNKHLFVVEGIVDQRDMGYKHSSRLVVNDQYI